jgi:fibronectin type 3 domain-containing protein
VPGKVSQLHAVVDQRQITLEWGKPVEHPDLADAYIVTRSDLPREPQIVSGTQYDDVQYQPGKVLTYEVTAVRRVGEITVPGSSPEAVTVTVEDKTPPQVPAGLDMVQSDMGAYLTWSPNLETDLAGYRVFRSDRANGDFRPVSDHVISTNAFFDPSYRSGQYYRVSAIDEFGNESVMSDPVQGP